MQFGSFLFLILPPYEKVYSETKLLKIAVGKYVGHFTNIYLFFNYYFSTFKID